MYIKKERNLIHMAFDGIVTKSIVTELNNIVGGKIDKIF